MGALKKHCPAAIKRLQKQVLNREKPGKTFDGG